MIRRLLGLYSWRYPMVLVYMLQNTEYQLGPYLKWYWQTNDFSNVMYRRKLHRTGPARLLLLAVRLGIIVEVAVGLLLIWLWLQNNFAGGLAFGLAALIAYPVVWAHLAALPLELGRLFIIKPKQWLNIRQSKPIFAKVRGTKVAIAGSYGKTSMKELLLTVLSEGKKVAATPANRNVSISHAYFARKLQGDEDILLIEYGEARPGDVTRFAEITQPTHAVITGIAPAHLDHYASMHQAGEDIFSVCKFVPKNQAYVNGESPDALTFVTSQQLYTEKGALGWHVSNVKADLHGTTFQMQKGDERLMIKSGLIGRHQVGPLAFAAAFAREQGLSNEQIEKGIAKTKPFEHRMAPYQLGGAWIIDDTYNGNIDGIRVGTKLLKELPAKRKIYVTPGLVDQGKESAKVHEEMGRLIAAAQPDIVVLMQHSVTPFIKKGLEAANFKGELLTESDPLNFYNNLQVFVAKGDVVLLQNDWPDNYA